MVLFTKRTNDPKLNWIERQLTSVNILWQRKGYSFHAPILYVEKNRIDDAWKILDPIDDIPDDDVRWTG